MTVGPKFFHQFLDLTAPSMVKHIMEFVTYKGKVSFVNIVFFTRERNQCLQKWRQISSFATAETGRFGSNGGWTFDRMFCLWDRESEGACQNCSSAATGGLKQRRHREKGDEHVRRRFIKHSKSDCEKRHCQ